jgi:PAS domain S-box-containing protein
MIDVQSMALTDASVNSPGDVASESGAARPTPPAGRVTLLLSIFLVHVAVGVWILVEANNLMRSVEVWMGPASGPASMRELAQRQIVVGLSVVGLGVVLTVLASFLFGAVEKYWTKHLDAAQAEAESKSKALTERVRVQAAEKVAAWEQLHKVRSEFEARITALTKAGREMEEELDRRKRVERAMSMQSQTIAASKDVLQIHVQARSKELQKLQRQYELILNAAGEGICGVDPEGKITFVNPTAARLMGLEVEKMVGRKETELFGALPQTDPAATEPKTEGRQAEVILTRTDNSTFTAEFMRSQIVENDQLVGRVVLFKDITERKQAAQALEQKADELARSNAELEQFAFVASHDLQEPLRKIRAFGDRLKMKCAQALPVEGADYLERMQNAAARMQTLIADLLTFSRVISRVESFVPVDLGQVVQGVLGDLEVRIEKVGATVEVGELPVIDGDPTQMRQLLQNLIGNALKFQLPGVKPHVRIAARLVSSPDDYGAGESFHELTVQDNGIGFDEKYLDKIFAVFQRLHNRQEYEGTGIGLAVCRRIVDRHGGSITARSKPGAGATFVVQLPARPLKKSK